MKKDSLKKLFLLLLCLVPFFVKGQTFPTLSDTEMNALLDKALGKLATGSFSIRFEGISLKVKDPMDIFTLPSYRVFKGGYLYNDQDKVEMNLAGMKTLCDGKIIVVIDEINKEVMIDSVNQNPSEKEEDVEKMLQQMGPAYAKGATLHYEGTKKVKGHQCYVISATLNGAELPQASLYYITIKEERMLLMAEKKESLYDVYWIDNIGNAPEKHSYKVHLPKRELQTWYGYKVTDLRY